MRSFGVAAAPAPLGVHPHVCSTYDDPDEFAAAALAFLEDSLCEDRRLLCVGAASAEAARALADADRHCASGRLATVVGDVYDEDSSARFAFYSAQTERALADGYAGLAVVAEVSGAADHPELWDEHVRWEQQADAYIASGAGMTALCGYRRGAVPQDSLTDMEAAHPLVWSARPLAGFRAYFEADRLALAGEVDRFGVGRLRRLLQFTPVTGAAPQVLDLAGLTFADGSATMTIGRWAADVAGRRIVGAPPTFLRVWQILGWQQRLGSEVASAR